MRKRRLTIAVLAAVLLIPAGMVPAIASTDTPPGLATVVGVGDSWTYGEGAPDPATGGYFALAHETLRTELDCSPAASDQAKDGCRTLQAMNIARPGTDTLPGVTTDIVITEQLPVIVPMISGRNGDANPHNDVEVIYFSAGGNDISGPVTAACIFGSTSTFISATFPYQAGLAMAQAPSPAFCQSSNRESICSVAALAAVFVSVIASSPLRAIR